MGLTLSGFMTGLWTDMQAVLVIIVGGSIAINWGTIWERIRRIELRPYVAYIDIALPYQYDMPTYVYIGPKLDAKRRAKVKRIAGLEYSEDVPKQGYQRMFFHDKNYWRRSRFVRAALTAILKDNISRGDRLVFLADCSWVVLEDWQKPVGNGTYTFQS